MTIRNVADSVIFVEKGNKLLIGGYDINRKRMPSEEFYQGSGESPFDRPEYRERTRRRFDDDDE